MLINRTLRRNFAGAAGGLQFKFPASYFFQNHISNPTGHHERSGNGLKRKEMSHTTNRTPGGESRLPTRHTRTRNLDVCVNILVEEVDGSSVLEQIRRVVDPSRYIIYPIKSSELGCSGWMSGCRLLVLTSDIAQTSTIDTFRESGGNIIKLENFSRASLLEAFRSKNIELIDGLGKTPVGGEDIKSKGVESGPLEVLLKTPVEAAGTTQGVTGRTPEVEGRTGALLSEHPDTFLQHPNIRSRLFSNKALRQGKTDLIFCASPEDLEQKINDNIFWINSSSSQTCETFQFKEFTSALTTDHIGRNILHFPVISSSMKPLEGAALVHGLAVVPDTQTHGRGRGGNRWLSPAGCAMFSLQLNLSAISNLGRRPSLVQHILGLAVVQALRRFEGELDVRLKWPNDIYYKNEVKLGGVIVNSSFIGSELMLNLGCGLNLDNLRPTVSVNQLLVGLGAAPVSRELYLAQIFDTLEFLIEQFNRGEEQNIFKMYYDVWLHGDQEVTLEGLQGQPASRVRIVGLDEFGYLQVQDDTSRSIFSVHDDGNSFDMMAGLIKPKFR